MIRYLWERLLQIRAWSVALLIGAFVVAFALDRAFGLGWTDALELKPDEVHAAWRALSTAPAQPSRWRGLVQLWTLVLAHGDVMHLLHNAVFFWLFGSLLVDVAGNRFLLIAFLGTAATASVAYAAARLGGPPAIGASGAISGVAGAYCLLAVRWDIPDAHAWPIAQPVAPMRAAAVALLAAALDIYGLSGASGETGVAHEAHLGGFFGGLVLSMLLSTFFPSRSAYRTSRWGRRLGRSRRRL